MNSGRGQLESNRQIGPDHQQYPCNYINRPTESHFIPETINAPQSSQVSEKLQLNNNKQLSVQSELNSKENSRSSCKKMELYTSPFKKDGNVEPLIFPEYSIGLLIIFWIKTYIFCKFKCI